MAMGSGIMSMRGLAAFAGGAAAALVASRVLPPIVAQAAGSATGRDPFQILADDHRAIHSLLEAMERSKPDATMTRMQLLLRFKRRLAAHALAEEDVVYPLLHDRVDAGSSAMHLYSEHADMKVHLHALEEMPKDDPLWADRVRTLRQLIEQHVRQEEDVDFPRLRALLDERATAKLAGGVRREKAMLL